MRSSSQGPRSKLQLSQSFNNKLNAYALAAGAAGVSVLAMIQPSEAEIIFTPADETFPSNQNAILDLNHDGVPDFRFFEFTFAPAYWIQTMRMYPAGGNGIVESSGGLYAAALNLGATIGPEQVFERKDEIKVVRSRGFRGSTTTTTGKRKKKDGKLDYRRLYGPWAYAQDKYLGVSFKIDGATHFGWIRLSVPNGSNFNGLVSGFAYETVADRPIKAGQVKEAGTASESKVEGQASLGALALGSTGVGVWRARQP
jgi:hypothetical protein